MYWQAHVNTPLSITPLLDLPDLSPILQAVDISHDNGPNQGYPWMLALGHSEGMALCQRPHKEVTLIQSVSIFKC